MDGAKVIEGGMDGVPHGVTLGGERWAVVEDMVLRTFRVGRAERADRARGGGVSGVGVFS